MKKFRELAGDADLRALLPPNANITVPHIIQASGVHAKVVSELGLLRQKAAVFAGLCRGSDNICVHTASETITPGSICVENRHAALERTGSSIRDSLLGQGARTAVLNDEVHNVYNATKERFLILPGYSAV